MIKFMKAPLTRLTILMVVQIASYAFPWERFVKDRYLIGFFAGIALVLFISEVIKDNAIYITEKKDKKHKGVDFGLQV